MPLLHLESLPPRTTRKDLVRYLTTVAKIDERQLGRLDVRRSVAVIEVSESWAGRLLKALDGASWNDRRLRARMGDVGVVGSGEDHFQRLGRLLKVEAAAEAEQARVRSARLADADAEQTGTALVDLVVVDEFSGLGGRCILTLTKRNRTLTLPWTRLHSGSPVSLSQGSEASWRGVVSERADRTIRVALNEPPADLDEANRCRLDLSSDEVARQRQQAALDRARTASRERLAELRQVLLGEEAPAFDAPTEFSPIDSSLNASQQEAVRLALSARDVAIIHGPPGTGKTRTVVELIRQAVQRGDKVLACAPSNLAVDNLLERLAAAGARVVRLGHPARISPGLRAHALDVLVEEHADARMARKTAKEAFALFRQAGKWTRAKPEPGTRGAQRQEARALLADARRLESLAVERVLDGADIVCSTTTALDSEVLGTRQFSLAVIDEACQTTEPGCWIPLARCGRVVLAGDHCQLPPTVLAADAIDQGFGISLLERLVELHGTAVTRRLAVQYRMHEAIMAFSSDEFYEGELNADPSVSGHRLCDLPGVQSDMLTETPVLFIDTAGASYDEEPEPGGDSRMNPQEAALVGRKVRALLALSVSADQIAVIAPYSAQVRLLRERLPIEGLEIDSVDGFQGREKEVVIVSLVRSNRENDIGFLGDVRRMNVALTRARRFLLVIGDSATLGGHPFYQRLLGYFESIGAYRSVWEEVDA
ncbi:MAG: AAA family ATPase [Gemmataceae bacterium]|nr:AAA family ATPase [Gemmataceae bacterium]